MKAILLAAGFGTRLRPLTDNTPKCLVPIDGRPLLDYWLATLIDSGIERVLVNCHYLAEQVVEHVATSAFARSVEIVHETVLLGTAGTLRVNRDFFGGEDGLLIHADNYSEANIRELIVTHSGRPKNCLLTMLTFRTSTPESCGIVEVDSDGVVVSYTEKPRDSPTNLANGAVYVLSGQLVGSLANESDFSTDVLPDLVGRMMSHETMAVHIDIGSRQSYAEANGLASQRRLSGR